MHILWRANSFVIQLARLLALMLLGSLAACGFGPGGAGRLYDAAVTPEKRHSSDNAFVVMEVRVVNASRERPNVTWQNISVKEGERSFTTRGATGLRAYSVRPGLYRLFSSNVSIQYFWEGRTDSYITFEAKPGEAVYVGVIAYTLTSSHFSIDVIDEYPQASAWAKERYPDQASRLRRELAHRRHIPGLDKPFGGR